MTNFFTHGVIKRSWRLAYIAFGLVSAVLYDVFFWDLQRGLGFLVFVILFTLGFVTLSAATKQIREQKAFFLLVPISIMSFDVMLYNNDLVTRGIPWFVLILMILFCILLTLQNPNSYEFSFSQIPILRNIEATFLKWATMWNDLFRWKTDGGKTTIRKVVIGIIISVPLLIIFTGLFAGADVVFADFIADIFNFNLEESTIWRVFRTVVLTLFISSVFYVLISKNNILGHKKNDVRKLDGTVVGTIFALLNVLFLIFVIIQFTYLFGGAEYVFERNLTFAEYARSGFFQLAWVIGLSAFMLVFFYRSASHHGSHAFLKFLKVFFIAQVIVIAISALFRMNLYQDEFGYTVKRLYVEWFIYFAVFILALSVVSIVIKWKFRNFLYTSMMLGLLALTIVSTINVDRVIVKENVDRYLNENKELDEHYLLHDLSIDVLPEFVRIQERGFTLSKSKENSSHTFSISVRDLSNKTSTKTKIYQERDSWREFNVGAEKGHDIINNLSTL
ncbi:MAG: DUF4173 domain-containing protein [Candidatus Magasanikbacteria bacterium]